MHRSCLKWIGIMLAVCLTIPPHAKVRAEKTAPNVVKNRAYYESRGDILWEVLTDKKVVALTFDDGPDATRTALILDLLKQYDAKATFFVLGKKVERYPDLVLREMREGHEIANHTYSHSMNKSKSIPFMMEEIRKTQNIILEVTGQRPRLYRPPGGIYNETLVRESRKEGLLTVMWSWHQDTRDWARPGTYKIVNKVLGNIRNGDIILFHDHVIGSMQTVEALKIIIPALKEQGYKFVTVSDLIQYDERYKSVEHLHPVQRN